MGKYIRKEKASSAGDLSPIELTQSSLGVRTRAKTLALQRLQKSPAAAATPSGDGSYLQLRSRTLVKSPVLAGDSKRHNKLGSKGGGNPNSRTGSRLKVNSLNSGSDGLESPAEKIVIRLETAGGKEGDINCGNDVDAGIEASLGENVLEVEGRERSSRENTPCSLMKDSDSNVRTPPGSTTKPASSTEANKQQNSVRGNIPTSCDMDDFFRGPEKQQQQQFIDKYNFDPVNEKPLPGRYEWVKLDH